MKQTTIYNWSIEVNNIDFSVLTNKNEVCIKSTFPDKSELFYGKLTENSIFIYYLDYYQIKLEIEIENKSIRLFNIEYDR